MHIAEGVIWMHKGKNLPASEDKSFLGSKISVILKRKRMLLVALIADVCYI